MKTFKKTLSLFLCVCILASAAVVASFSASANAGDALHRPKVTDIVPADAATNTFYFYMPQAWRNEINDTYDGTSLDSCSAGIYWWEGSYHCKEEANMGGTGQDWPGYVIPDTDPADPNIFVVKVPTDVVTLVFNNAVDGGSDSTGPNYTKAIQTGDVGTEYYSPGEDGYGFYPEGTETFNNMIYVCNPKAIDVNPFSGKETYKGVWFYYYGNGEYGINKERVEGEVYKNGEFPPYGFQVDETAEVEVGQVADIFCNDNTATATVADPSIAEIIKDEKTGKFSVKGLKAGTTTISFTITKDGESETLECKVTVKAKPAAVTKKTNKMKVTVASVKKLTTKANKKVKGKKVTKKAVTFKKAIKVTNNKGGKVSYSVVKKGSNTKQLSVNKKGYVTVKKGTKKGTYKIKVKVTAKATSKYKSASKTVTVKVKVK